MTASADVTVYGRLHYSIDSWDIEAAATGLGGMDIATPVLGAAFDGSAVNSHASRFGIKGSEDLGNGLSALFQMEFQINADNGSLLSTTGSVENNRNTFVALAGSWGVAGVGRVDTPYKSSTSSLELFGDNIGDYGNIGMHDVRADDAVFYMSPNWNGFSFVAAIVMPSVIDNLSDGVEATSIAGTYTNGPWFASLAYEQVEEWTAWALGMGTGTSGNVNNRDDEKWRLGLGYTANGWHVGFIYEDREQADGTDHDIWQLSGSYTMGNNTLKVAYADRDNDVAGEADPDQWTVGVDHKMSSRTTVYARYSDYDGDAVNADWDALSLGIIHKF
jgi:predicted porin